MTAVDVDVSTSAGLAAALDAVADQPGAWESPLGCRVAEEIVRVLPERVGPARIAELVSASSAGRDEVVADLASSVVEMLLMRRDLSAAGGDLWATLVRRAVWMVQGHQERARQHGLSGDHAHPHRMRERVSCTSVDVADLASGTGYTPPGAMEVERRRTWVRSEDLGPCLAGVIDALVWARVPAWLARAGTCRVVELAASTYARERHRSAREDARKGVLTALGVSQDAAGAWMSLVMGSRRGGLESALLWTLRERNAASLPLAGLTWSKVLSDSQMRWLRTVAGGVMVQAPAAPAPARRAPVGHLTGTGEQLTLFPVEGVSAGAAA